MTEAQGATLARRGSVPDRDLTWVQASLLIDDATGSPRGIQATRWLRENGASTDLAASVIDRAKRYLRTPSDTEDVRARQRQRRRAWAAASRPDPRAGAGQASTGPSAVRRSAGSR
jgi:hypothetical protein